MRYLLPLLLLLFARVPAVAGDHARRELLQRAEEAFQQEHYAEARELYALACKATIDDRGTELLSCLLRWVNASKYGGNVSEAPELYTRARTLCLDRSILCASLWYELASLYRYLGRLPEAELMIRQALSAIHGSARESAIDRVRFTVCLGGILLDKGMAEEAEQLLQSAVSTARLEMPESKDLALAQAQLAMVLITRQRYTEAARLLTDNLRTASNAPGQDDLRTADALLQLGAVYRLQANAARALPLVWRAAAIYEQRSGPESLELAATLREEGLLALQTKKPVTAEQYFQRALNIYNSTFPAESLDVLGLRHALAQAYILQNRTQRAESLLQAIVDIERRTKTDSEQLAACLAELGKLYGRLHRLGAAKTCYEESISIFERLGSSSHEFQAVLLGYAALIKSTEHAKARQLIQRANSLAAP